MFTGFDTDRTMLRLSAMNLMLHSITQPHIDYVDSVSQQNSLSSAYDIVLANPPFKGTIDEESINDNLMTACRGYWHIQKHKMYLT
ncbi:MAG: N-6 DNA methylase [Eubacteriales bacterium]